MDLKIYEKTRYQNIYRHKKNKNYIVMMSKPVKTSIASIDGKKIFRIEDATNIRDNFEIKNQKAVEKAVSGSFDDLWDNYIVWCETSEKQAFNTIIRKKKTYNKYLKNVFKKKISNITEEDFVYYLEKLSCTDKTKNQILKETKAFFNWCVSKKILLYNPTANIKRYKVSKTEMNFWTPEELKRFLETIEYDINNNINKEIAYRTKIFTLIGFSLGNRTGETRALRFNSFDKIKSTVRINSSIEYNRKSEQYLKTTKTKGSDREIDVSPKLIDEILKYKWHLINEFDYDIIDNELIFCNHNTKVPLTDTTLRKHFYNYCEKAKVQKIRMYDLRHTYVATMMMEGKELYHISKRIGHKSYNTTVDKYGHLSSKIRKEIAEITDKYI